MTQTNTFQESIIYYKRIVKVNDSVSLVSMQCHFSSLFQKYYISPYQLQREEDLNDDKSQERIHLY